MPAGPIFERHPSMKLPLTFLDVSQHLTNKILALTGAKSGVYHRAMVPLSVYLIVVEDRVPRAYPCGNEPGDVNDARTDYTGTAHSV
jgi:hypothetical protein